MMRAQQGPGGGLFRQRRHVPAQRQGIGPYHDLSRPHSPAPVPAVAKHLRISRHMQEVTCREIDEQQPGPAVQPDVAERVEVAVPAKVGDGQHPVRVDLHEARAAAPVRHVGLAMAIRAVCVGGHEESVGRGHERPGVRIQPIA